MSRLPDAWRDLRCAANSLRRAPTFSVVAIVSLGAGIALTATTVSVVNAYLIRSLPYPAATRLYNVRYARDAAPQPEGLERVDWTSLQDVVELAMASDPDVLYLTEGGYTQPAPMSRVTPDFLEGLGLRPAIGRSFRPADGEAGAERVALISQALWRDRFASDPHIEGRRFRAYSAEDARATATFTIVGVLPAGTWTARRIDVLFPLKAGVVPAYAVRLLEDVTVEQAEQRISARVRNDASSLPPAWDGVRLQSAHDQYVSPLRPTLTAVTTASALVLVIVCANVAVLMLLRSTRRQKEVAIRLALGAGRADVFRSLVAEAGLLSGLAFAIGIAISAVTLRAIAPLIETSLGKGAAGGSAAIAIDATVLVTVGAIGLAVALSLSLTPLLASWRRDLSSTLRQDGRSGAGTPAGRRLRSILTAFEVAGSLALLVGCGLMLRTVTHLSHTDLGFRTDRIVVAAFSLPAKPYDDPAALTAFYDRLLEKLGPSAGVSDWPPFAELLRHPSEADAAQAGDLRVGVISVGGRYFETLGMRAVDGRTFQPGDRFGAEPVALVSESLAHRLWPDGRAVGRRIRTAEEVSVWAPLASWRTVVGVMADVRQTFTDTDARDVYLPFLQVPNRFSSLYLSTDAPVSEWLNRLRTAVSGINAEVSVTASPSLTSAANRLLAGPRFLAWLLAGYALFTVLLAVLGIYGVVSFGVQQREREIAIRVALGATAGRITAMLVGRGAMLLAVGVGFGLAGSALVTRMLQAQLHGVTAFDALTLATASITLAVAGLLATWWPARRAASRDPLTALKSD